MSKPPIELLSPAGEPESAFAAFHYGADAVYLGLRQFSARAHAQNFSLEQLQELTIYAHSLSPRRRVFVAFNTLVREKELKNIVESIWAVQDIGVDAVIVQDLGVARIIRRHCPKLEMHASTQMAIHNLAGARVLQQLGFSRVTLARELNLKEIKSIANESGIETEVFIHGSLCYSYSGLCSFSSHVYGRSSNRGQCSYPCREVFRLNQIRTDKSENEFAPSRSEGLFFSMKDLALLDEILKFKDCGVSSLKIEGRMKSPLYVACATDMYRKALDGKLSDAEKAAHENDLRTIFSRPWTKLQLLPVRKGEAIDPDFTGHRGALIGQVQQAFVNRKGEQIIRFRSKRRLEIHDGLQLELPGRSKPYGFAIEQLAWRKNDSGKAKDDFISPADSLVDIALPRESPPVGAGIKVYCASSQSVKQRYNFERPKIGLYQRKYPIIVRLEVCTDGIRVSAALADGSLSHKSTTKEALEPAKDPAAVERAIKDAFSKLGGTNLTLQSIDVINEQKLFIPVSKLNSLRRELAQILALKIEQAGSLSKEEFCSKVLVLDSSFPAAPGSVLWSIKAAKLAYFADFSRSDWQGVEEVGVELAENSVEELTVGLPQLAKNCGFEQIRLCLPIITRAWEEKNLLSKIKLLYQSGWRRFVAANLSALAFLENCPDCEFSFDCTVPILNTFAAAYAQELGANSISFAPEDTIENLKLLLPKLGSFGQTIVYQDTPLFISESCAYAGMIGCCPGLDKCPACASAPPEQPLSPIKLTSQNNGEFLLLQKNCRTVIIRREPYSIATQLPALPGAGAQRLRADFTLRPYSSKKVIKIWRELRKLTER